MRTPGAIAPGAKRRWRVASEEEAMICVLQRVSSARVEVGDETVGAIDGGFLALVGVLPADGDEDVAYIADRVRGLRVFADAAGKMNLDVVAAGGAVLLVSQFTLAADLSRGRRPSFATAAPPDAAAARLEALAGALRARGLTVETGSFGAAMQVHLQNDGPVTIIVDSTARHRQEAQ